MLLPKEGNVAEKLTKAQREMLERLERWGPGPADAKYGPALALLERGCVTREIRRNKMRLHIFTITPTGRAALRPTDGEGQ